MTDIDRTATGAPSLARRIVAFPLTLMLIALVMVVGASALANLAGDQIARKAGSPLLLVHALIFISVLLAAYWLFCRFVERAPMRVFATVGWARETLAGLAAGALIFSMAVAIVYALGGYRVAGWGELATVWTALNLSLMSGFAEELLFRGILFRYIERTAGSWIALLITSAMFGAAHFANPNAGIGPAVAIAVEAGILLGAVYMLTQRLWAAMGLHAAWNFTQGWIFGLPVSGGAGGDGMVRGELVGPEWLTGGAFGLEASLPGVLVATVAGLTILYIAVRRGRVMAPMWSTSQRKE